MKETLGKNICIIMGSPRKNGNTNHLLVPFTEELKALGCSCHTVWLYDKDIRPCSACRSCQKDWSIFGCCQKDDMQEIFDMVLAADLIVLATPVYSWYCTPPVKSVLDRLVYGMNKYYGEAKGPALWEGKKVALLTTCGYHPEQGADLWEEGIKRYCKHSRLEYISMLAERDMGYQTVFMDETKKQHVVRFAGELSAVLDSRPMQ